MYYIKNFNRRIKSKSNLFVWCFVLVMMAAIAIGDVGQEPNDTAVVEDAGQASIDVNSMTADVTTDGMIQSITFKKNMGIREALTFLALKYNKNIVPSPEVDGQLAFTSLFEVTFEDAMDAILGGKFEYEQKGNLIEVFPKGDKNRMRYEVFALHYISAAEAKKLITPVLSTSGQVGVTSPAETGVPVGESISAPSGGGDTMSLKDTIVVYDYAENIAKAREVIKSIDARPQEVLVEATLLSATLTEDTQFGIDWNTLKGSAISSLTGTSGITKDSANYFKSLGTAFGGATALSGGLTVGLVLGDIASFIRAVEQITDVTVLANPKILAVNKQLGQVYIGDKIGYESETTNYEGAVSTAKVSFLDTGTKLSFRPYISPDGYIRMDIHAKNSAQKQGGVISETSTELVSNVMVKDGQTIAIGGLFQDTIDTRKTQVPLLGDLPVVGALFRGTSDNNVRKEVIVLLTPHILEEPGEANGWARAEDVSRKRFGAKEEMQWIKRTRLVEDRYAKAAKYYVDGYPELALKELETVLQLYPAYLEAIRLKERIIAETDPQARANLERSILKDIERQEAENWRSR